MPNNVTQQISRVPTALLNTVNDQYPGGQQSLSGANIYAAQKGARMWLDGNTGGVKYDSVNVGTLYGGVFQYVQFYASESAAAAIGRPVAWAYDQVTVAADVYKAFQSYIVTTDTNSALRTGRTAGVALCVVTAGYYGWIQTKGVAPVLYATLTGTPVDGDLLYVDSSSGNVLNAVDATSITAGILKAAIGVALGTPTSGTVGKALLKGLPDVV